MKNPLRKRYLRELKEDFGKYIAIALFMIMLIGLVSGYLVAAGSVEKTFYEGWEKYNVEDGHITFYEIPKDDLLEQIEKDADLKLYNLEYFEEDIDSKGTTLRVFKDKAGIDGQCLMEGNLPSKENEIAIDRLFAENNAIKIGDTLTINNKPVEVTGLIARVDYNCLYENNNDMVFNASIFGVGIMSEEGFEWIDSDHLFANYAWKYNEKPIDEIEENEKSEAFIDALEDIIKDYGKKGTWVQIDSYIPRYQNKSIKYCIDDMSSDKPMFILFDYIVVAILAFVFAVTTSSTIQKEAGVIGTLRASGYTKWEMVRHYLFMPVAVTVIAAIIGNILGYTVFVDMMKGVFYNSFSLAAYESVFNIEAFVDTTVIPLLIMIAVNVYMLLSKLNLSPIRFLRKDLAKKKKRRAVLLNKKIPFITRFKLRILFQNSSAYIVLIFGVLFGGIIAIFGFMFGPLLDDYADLIISERICDYQYVLMNQVETDTEGAEKYCLTSLDSTFEGYIKDEISIYGIVDDSAYITKNIPSGEVLVSEGVAEKFKLKPGEIISLKDPYSDEIYEFKIADTYAYSASLAAFMTRDDYIKTFDEDEDYFTGYFSQNKIEDIDDRNIATIITTSDLTKASDQMQDSMGEFMSLFKYFGAIMLALLMYLMAKQVIEKKAQSIAMTKILGFRNNEIAKLYLLMTGIVVLFAMIITVPVTDAALKWLFKNYLYKELSGYIPYIVSNTCYVYMFVIGIGCFALVSICMFAKIGRIEKSEALKNVE